MLVMLVIQNMRFFVKVMSFRIKMDSILCSLPFSSSVAQKQVASRSPSQQRGYLSLGPSLLLVFSFLLKVSFFAHRWAILSFL